MPHADALGEYGAIPKWFHLECAKRDEILVGYAKLGDAKLKNVVLGWDALTKDEWLGDDCHPSLVLLVIWNVFWVIGPRSRLWLLLVCFLIPFHIFSQMELGSSMITM